MNFDALNVDFIRRVTPPSLKEVCIPHSPKLRIIVKEQYSLAHDSELFPNQLLLATDIHVNNPISNTLLKGKFSYPHPLEFNPSIVDGDYDDDGGGGSGGSGDGDSGNNRMLTLPLGYYPVAQCRKVLKEDIADITSNLNDDIWSLSFTNNSKLNLQDVNLIIDFPSHLD